MKKVLFVFGTRPEAIKMVPLIKMFKNDHRYETKILITAQHRSMLDQVLNLFDVRPDFDLNIMQGNQDLTDITCKVLYGCREIFQKFRPDLIFVHGDTTTTFAASLAGFYSQIKVAHVEAGLRTYDLYSPYPEELNRQIASKVSTFHLAPTETSKQNLLKEGIDVTNILVSGNTVIDTLFLAKDLLVQGQFKQEHYKSAGRKYVLITGHRRENFGAGFENICRAIKSLATKYPDFDFVYPVHLNPNVRAPVNSILAGTENIKLLEPLEYLPFVSLMKESFLILTDSGGIQEEAPSLGRPVLVMRDTSERPEAIQAGTVELVGTSEEKIVQKVSELIDSPSRYASMQKASNPYGDGKASERILAFISQKFGI